MERDAEKIAELKKLARKTKEAKQRRRYDIVRLYMEGWKKAEIARIVDMSLQGISMC